MAVAYTLHSVDLAVPQHRAEWTAVRDDENGAARMLTGNFLERFEDAPGHLLARLPVAKRAARDLLGKTFLDFGVAQPLDRKSVV